MVKDLVSVIITVYNGSKFISCCIESILGQTYKDFECIIVDDGSTDNTAKIVHSFQDSRIRLIQPGRIGRGRALNAGIKASKGEFIAIQDADDFSHHKRLEIEVSILKKDQKIAVLGSGHRFIFSQDSFSSDLFKADINENGTVMDVFSRLLWINPLSHTSLMVQRYALEQVDGYDQTRRNLFDWDLLLRLFERGYNPYRYSFPLVYKRIHKGQFFEMKKRYVYVSGCFSIQRRAMTSMKKHLLWLIPLSFLYIYRLTPQWLRMSTRKWQYRLWRTDC